MPPLGGGVACHLGLLEGQRAAWGAQGVVGVDAVFEDAAAGPGRGVAGDLAEAGGQHSAVWGAGEGGDAEVGDAAVSALIAGAVAGGGVAGHGAGGTAG